MKSQQKGRQKIHLFHNKYMFIGESTIYPSSEGEGRGQYFAIYQNHLNIVQFRPNKWKPKKFWFFNISKIGLKMYTDLEKDSGVEYYKIRKSEWPAG